MSALGQKQTSRHVRVMSVIPLNADISQRDLHVRLVPIADIANKQPPWPPDKLRLIIFSVSGGRHGALLCRAHCCFSY